MGGHFHPYGASHLAAIVVLLSGLGPAVWTGRLDRAAGRPGRTARVAGWALLVVVVPVQVYDALPGRFQLDHSLPLQLSDLAWIAAAVALITLRPAAVALTYYWGLTLTVQAIVTPSLAQDWPDLHYVGFWVRHVIVVWAALHLVWGLGLRPGWRDYRLVVGVTAVWLVVALAVNAVAGTNYGYVSRKPATATALDYLGPWPLYVGAEIVILAVVWALMTWPWTRAPRTVGGLP